MHETGMAEALVEALRKVQADLETPIKVARMEIGELAGITPEHLAEHFYEAAEGTEFEGVTLEAEVVGLTAQCGKCGAVVEITDDVDACAQCGSEDLAVQAHDTIKLVSVE